MRVRQYGLDADLPPGWEGRIFRRGGRDAEEARAAAGTVNPVLHAANFPLPEERGDFGSGAVDVMRSAHVFLSLVEYDPEAAYTPLFSSPVPPWPLDANSFSPARLQRHIPGQAGNQFFFTHEDRAFCLYVVLGSHLDRRTLVSQRLNPALDRLRVGRRSGL